MEFELEPQCNPVKQLTGPDHVRYAIACVREMPLVASNEVIGLCRFRALQKLGVTWIGGDGRRGLWHHKLAVLAKHDEQRRVRPATESGDKPVA